MKIIGLDIGTTNICGVVYDTASGLVEKSLSKRNNCFIDSPLPYEKIQDAGKILSLVNEIYSELRKGEDTGGVGITGQMHGIVYIDADGMPVSPLYTWQDGRGDIALGDETYAQRLSRLSGYKLSSGYGSVTHFCNVLERKVPENAVSFCTIGSLAAMSLTGGSKPFVHPTDAASIGLYDALNMRFSGEIITACGMDPSTFPAVSEDVQAAGFTDDGIPVSVAIGDNQAGVLGATGDCSDAAVINAGTGGQVSVICDAAQLPPGIESRPYFFGKNIAVGSSLCGGRAYALLKSFIEDTVYSVTGALPENVYKVMDRLASCDDAEDGDERLAVNTLFDGTREDPSVRGSIGNIGVNNFNLRALCRGFVDGMAEELYGLYARILPCLEKVPETILAAGNGIRANAPLLKRLSERFGREIIVPANREEAAVGAAIYASYVIDKQ